MIYTWKCEECEKNTECIRKLADIDVPPEKCDHCHCEKFSQFVVVRPTNCKGYILEGGGWHNDEYTRYRCIKS